MGALAIIVGSLIASGRHRGGGEDLIDKMADRVHAEYEDAAAQRELEGESGVEGGVEAPAGALAEPSATPEAPAQSTP